jgi:dTMP kinase
VKALCELATDALQPELTILLDAAPEALLQRRADRGVKDRFEQEGLDFQKKVREGFLLLANADPVRVKKVNALQNTEAVQADIRKIFREAGF